MIGSVLQTRSVMADRYDCYRRESLCRVTMFLENDPRSVGFSCHASLPLTLLLQLVGMFARQSRILCCAHLTRLVRPIRLSRCLATLAEVCRTEGAWGKRS